MENLHYIDRVPLHYLVAEPSRPLGRVRKRRMQPSTLTYPELEQLLLKKIDTGQGASKSSKANLRSAMGAFLAERGISPDAPIGSTLRAGYYKNLQSHLQALRDEGRASGYVRNRKALMATWRRVVVEYDRYCAVVLKQATPFQRAMLDIFEGGVTKKGLARATGISLATFKRWCSGNIPQKRSVSHIIRLERYLGLPAGQLTELLPFEVVASAPEEPMVIEYRQRMKVLVRKRYTVTQPTPQLAQEWAEFLQYKVAELDCEESEGQALKRSLRGRWTATSNSGSAPRASNWALWHKGRYVASAGLAWGHCAQFFGWLMLPAEQGGLGLPATEAQTLSNLLKRQYVRDFIDWKRQRAAGATHGGIISFVRFVSSLCNPTTGYLTQRWRTFTRGTDTTEEAWRASCRRTFDSMAKLRAELTDEFSPSRRPADPIKHILALSNPLEAIADMVIRMQSAKPTSGGIREAVWARDILLIKLVTSNPLRDKNLRMLTYLPDNSGHLRQDPDGSWYIHVGRRELKNHNGAAKDRDYQMPVHKEVWPDIERYLKQYRSVLAKRGSSSDVLFLTGVNAAAFTDKALSHRFRKITRKHLHGCPGVGPHAFRYIVATSILKASPNDWVAASWALHDREETVRKHYAHLAKNDAALWMGKAMDGPFSRM